MTSSKYRIFDKIIEGVQIVDNTFRYVYVNDTVTIHGKFTREELLGYTMSEKYPGIEQTEMFSMIRKCMVDEAPVQMLNEFDFPDGSKGYFELRMQKVPEGILIMSFDVSKQKQAEQILQHSNTILDEKVRQRTSQLRAKNNELEQFVYIASHDLQEPLRTIANYIQVIKEDYTGILDEAVIQYLNAANRAAERMSLLTQALLDYSRLGQGQKRSVVSVSNLLKEVMDDLENMIRSTGAVIRIGEMPELNVYPTEMRQIFQNLITNAIKFRKPDTKPEIHITAEHKQKQWIFSVRDNGIGIEKQHYERIFQIFQRLHLNEVYEGSGIGLANCKKIAELHGGAITVESEFGKGSTFIFTISEEI